MNVTIVFSLGFVLLLAGMLAFVMMLAGRSKASDGNGGLCGRCGYSTRGLITFECPECGSDLREVGIVAPRKSIPHTLFSGKLVFILIAVFILITFMAYIWSLPPNFAPPQMPLNPSQAGD